MALPDWLSMPRREWTAFCRLQAAVKGSLKQVCVLEIAVGKRAAAGAIRTATEGLKLELRRQVVGAGLGQRLANSWRGEVYGAGKSLAPGGYIFTKAPLIIRAFAYGATIKAKSGGFLAVPLPAAGKWADGRKRVTPERWEQATGLKLRFVYRRGRTGLLVADEGVRMGSKGIAKARQGRARRRKPTVTIPIFALVPQVTLKKRLDIEGAAAKWGSALPVLLAAAWKTPAVR